VEFLTTATNSIGLYHLTGLVHISEVSWDLVQDVKDFLNEGDAVKVIVVNIDM
jgi:predicted RNA-binding protein with RPS1 domain